MAGTHIKKLIVIFLGHMHFCLTGYVAAMGKKDYQKIYIYNYLPSYCVIIITFCLGR